MDCLQMILRRWFFWGFQLIYLTRVGYRCVCLMFLHPTIGTFSGIFISQKHLSEILLSFGYPNHISFCLLHGHLIMCGALDVMMLLHQRCFYVKISILHCCLNLLKYLRRCAYRHYLYIKNDACSMIAGSFWQMGWCDEKEKSHSWKYYKFGSWTTTF